MKIREIQTYPRGDSFREHVTISGSLSADLSDALDIEHPCEDVSCGIAAMMANGYYTAAAWSLMGATECPLVEGVLAAYRAFLPRYRADIGTNLYDCADWEGWKAHFDRWARHCDACGAYNYAEPHWEPTRCGNCLANLPEPPDAD